MTSDNQEKRNYRILSFILLSGYFLLNVIVTIKSFDAHQMSLISKISMIGGLWLFWGWAIYALLKHYKRFE
jgi:hypothetical protein